MEKIYTCPMHPEVVSDKPGKCPKCGMNLVLKENLPLKKVGDDKGLGVITWKSYLPLLTVVGVILLMTIALSLQDNMLGICSIAKTISYFMIGFFLTKLMDLKGFAEGYSTYDLLAQKVPAYGYIYPFIEIFFGVAMILMPTSQMLLWAEIIMMAFSGLGVSIKIAKKEPFMCVCLGTFLKIPLTKVTLIEDFGMAFLALIMLYFRL